MADDLDYSTAQDIYSLMARLTTEYLVKERDGHKKGEDFPYDKLMETRKVLAEYLNNKDKEAGKPKNPPRL